MTLVLPRPCDALWGACCDLAQELRLGLLFEIASPEGSGGQDGFGNPLS